MGSSSCFNCVHLKQGNQSMQCNHPNKVDYQNIKTPCSCGRNPDEHVKGCGSCIGRGQYCYPGIYDTCDCNGFEIKQTNAQ